MDDLDYLFATARIRAMEGKLLSETKLVEIINAESYEEAVRRLEENGWEAPDFTSYDAMNRTLAAERLRVFKEVEAFAPDKSMVRYFRLKYDYHNLKALLKAKAKNESAEGVLSGCGNIPAEKMINIVAEESFAQLSPAMRNSVIEASEILARTQDPLYADMALDKACFSEMLAFAKSSESKFLAGYTSLQIDAINLLTAVRIKKRGLTYDYLREAFISGGSVAQSKLLTELTPEAVENAYAASSLTLAPAAAASVLRGEAGLSALDSAADNDLMNYLKSAKYIGLGEQPLVAFIAAKEAELTALRTVFGGRLAGLEPASIRERLRESYV